MHEQLQRRCGDKGAIVAHNNCSTNVLDVQAGLFFVSTATNHTAYSVPSMSQTVRSVWKGQPVTYTRHAKEEGNAGEAARSGGSVAAAAEVGGRVDDHQSWISLVLCGVVMCLVCGFVVLCCCCGNGGWRRSASLRRLDLGASSAAAASLPTAPARAASKAWTRRSLSLLRAVD